jgi:hypothetical protein
MQWQSIWFVIWRSKVVLKSVFFQNIAGNSGGAENSAEISGTNGITFFCYMYESSLRHLVWVPEINVKACNSVAFPPTFFTSLGWIVSISFSRLVSSPRFLKVHKIENFFVSEFEFCTISLLVLLKYKDFVTIIFW